MFIEFLAKQNEYVQQLYARLLIEKALLALSNHLIFTISGGKKPLNLIPSDNSG